MQVRSWPEWVEVRDNAEAIKPVGAGFEQRVDPSTVRTLFGSRIEPDEPPSYDVAVDRSRPQRPGRRQLPRPSGSQGDRGRGPRRGRWRLRQRGADRGGTRDGRRARSSPGCSPPVVADLELKRFGSRCTSPTCSASASSATGATCSCGCALHRTLREIERYSPRDAQRFLDFGLRLRRFADLVRPWLLKPPPMRPELPPASQEAAEGYLSDEFALTSSPATCSTATSSPST